MRIPTILAASLLASLTLTAGSAAVAAGSSPRVFDSSRFSQSVTECDRMASHPDDPNKVIPGLERAQMDLEAAIVTCRADLAKDSANPRLLYLLARALTYAGRVDEALPYIEKSAAAGYPQSLFVTGYLYLDGAYKAPKNPCRAGELIRESALYGRMAGQVGFTKYALDGRFKGCAVKQDWDEMAGFLAAAKATKPEYYTELLIDTLQKDLTAARAASAVTK
jgi:tetratricopeptide (TPR) repeat protein